MIYVSGDKSEAHFAVSESLQSGLWNTRESSFFLIGIRFVRIRDEETVVGWCTKACCADSGLHVQGVFELTHYTQRSAADFAELKLTCEWSQKMIAAWGGPEKLKTIMHAATSSPACDVLVKTFSLPHKRFEVSAKAVRAGQSFSDWAVIVKHLTKEAWFCTACDHPHTCPHINAAISPGTSTSFVTMSDEQFERKLGKDFEFTSGEFHFPTVCTASTAGHVLSNVSSFSDIMHYCAAVDV